MNTKIHYRLRYWVQVILDGGHLAQDALIEDLRETDELIVTLLTRIAELEAAKRIAE